MTSTDLHWISLPPPLCRRFPPFDTKNLFFSWSGVARVAVDGLTRRAANCVDVAQRALRLLAAAGAEGEASGSNEIKVKATHLK